MRAKIRFHGYVSARCGGAISVPSVAASINTLNSTNLDFLEPSDEERGGAAMETVCLFFGCDLSGRSSAGTATMLTTSLLPSTPFSEWYSTPSPGVVIVFSKTRCR